MVSALAVAGRIGLTATGDTPSEASALYRELKQTLDTLAATVTGATPDPRPTAPCVLVSAQLRRD